MNNTLHSHNITIKMNGRIITDLKFADNIYGLTGFEEELVSLANITGFYMEINQTKTTLMLNDNICNPLITIMNKSISLTTSNI